MKKKHQKTTDKNEFEYCFTCGCTFRILFHANSYSTNGILASRRYCRKPRSSGFKNNNALP